MVETTCFKCNGSGWIIVERDGVSGAERCDCVNVGREQRIEDNANIPPLYRNSSVDSFLLPQDNPTAHRAMASILLMVRSYAREFPSLDKPGLLFIGPPGCGKTHLAVAALRMLIAKGFEGVFFDFQNLLDRIRSGYDESSGASDKEAYRKALDSEVVLLDDLGAHRVKEWVEDTVTSIVTHRCNHRKALIITTNLRDPITGDKRNSGLQDDVHSKYFLEERIGMRARSRLFEMCRVIRMPAIEDHRLRTAKVMGSAGPQ